jgi:hypothetical protein
LLRAESRFVCIQLPNLFVFSYPTCLYSATRFVCIQLPNLFVFSYPICLYSATQLVCIQLPNLFVFSYPICLYSATQFAASRTARPSLATSLPNADGFLVIAIRPKCKGNFRTAAIFLSYLLPNASFIIRTYSKI